MQIPTHADKHPGRFKKNGKGVWSASVVAAILSNETHSGIWHYKCAAGWLSVEVPAIVSRELWEKAQERRAYNAKMSKRNTKRDYLLAKRGTCQCGSKMSARTTISGSRKYPYYYCPAAWRRLVGKTCDMPFIRADHVDAAVWEWVKGLLLNPEALRENLKEQQAEQGRVNKPLYDRLAVIDDLLAENRQKLERLLDLYLAGDFDKELLTGRKARLENMIASLEKERANLVATLEAQTLTDDQILTIADFAKEVAGGLKEAETSFKARRYIIDLLDVRVTMAIEDGQKVAYVQCLVDEADLSIVSTSLKSPIWDTLVPSDPPPDTAGC
jgi:site-specific DNA recombinase